VNQYDRLLESEDDPTFGELCEMMQTHEGMSPAKGARHSNSGKRRARTAPKTKSLGRRLPDAEPTVPLARLHAGGLTSEAHRYYRSKPGLAREHAARLASEILTTGNLPTLPVPVIPNARRYGMEIYGLQPEQVAALKSRPRLIGDFLNMIAQAQYAFDVSPQA